VNDRPSTLGARASGPRAGRRFDAEHGVATEALIFLGDLDPEAIGPNLEHATHYEPTPVGDLQPLLDMVPIRLDGTTFVDLGAGMGRALLLAARLPFRQAIGVEISPALCEIARDNLANVSRAQFRCRDLRVVCADAATYRFPRGDLVVYLYNPFDGSVLAEVLDRLARGPAREVVLVYHTPVAREVVESHPSFELAAESATGAVYRLAGSSRASAGTRS
jgi:SAM-dependent methyltransferase